MKSKILRIGLLVCAFIMFFSVNVDAKVTSTDPSVQSGGDVTITLKSSESAYAYKITLADAGGLTFVSASSSAGQANGSTANGASTSGVTTLATYKFKAPTVSETKKYSVKFNVSVSTDGENFTSSTNTSSVTVKAIETPSIQQPETPSIQQPETPSTPTKSSDATLASITIGNKKYSGSSLKNTITHTVDFSVASTKISVAKNNSKANVSGTGTKSLVAGQTNSFKINVTAEDGTKKTYTVNIIRLAEEKQEPNIIENDSPVEEVKLALTSLVIKDVELNTEFKPEIYNYIANVENMKELEIVATVNKTEAQISIEGATELKEGDNKVKVIAILGEERVEYIIDVYNTIKEEVVGSIEDNNDTLEENKNIVGRIQDFTSKNIKKILLITLIIILSMIAIKYVALSYKYSNMLKELTGLEPQKNTENVEDTGLKNQNIKSRTGRHF